MSSSDLIIVLLTGGGIALAGSLSVYFLDWLRTSSRSRRERVAVLRVWRDDFRAAQTQVAKAIRADAWWSEQDRVPSLLTFDQIVTTAQRLKSWEDWAPIADARRMLLRAEQHRDASRPFDRLKAARLFERLERAREIVAARAGDPFKPHGDLTWVREVAELHQ